MPSIEFRDPPARSGAPVRVTTFHRLLAIKDQPGRWAVMAKFKNQGSAQSYVSRVRRNPTWRPEGSFEFTVRSLGGGGAEVYAMASEPNSKVAR